MCDFDQPLFSEQILRLLKSTKNPEPNSPDTPPPTTPGGYKRNLGPEPPRPLEPPSGLSMSPYKQRGHLMLSAPSDSRTGTTPPPVPRPPPNSPDKKRGDLVLPEASDSRTGTTPPPRPKTPPNTPKKHSGDYSFNTPSPPPRHYSPTILPNNRFRNFAPLGMVDIIACA
ncbi:hypothetical protein BKA58DRAFT_467516 [Alternaria rosae]|uniref:uncharacterized protein n=1 Tax=Alternaria rosae TaxID=1187941 RepID=UPI001E8DCCC1|nr:uncharacterized protein BKA58DRAFT_467516 [Alternaria rosae]KAH6875773.1 hypothetical protein BKA58DRAFT_467516 [Alternaria rosae]